MTRRDSLELRSAVLVVLHRAGTPLDLQHLLEEVRALGLEPGHGWREDRRSPDATARKVLSGTLRTELAKGRVVRARHGVYRAGPLPPRTTWRRITLTVEARRRGLEWTVDSAGRHHLAIPGWPA
jgi:hypothetical protein